VPPFVYVGQKKLSLGRKDIPTGKRLGSYGLIVLSDMKYRVHTCHGITTNVMTADT
jgi:hypothetical protein